MQARSDVKQKVAFLPSSSRQCQTLFYFDQKGKSVNCESTSGTSGTSGTSTIPGGTVRT